MRSISTTTMSTSSNSSLNGAQRLDWETLRKQARQLENEIDSKLVAYSKLNSNYTSSMISPLSGGQSSQSSATSSSDLLFITLSNEIDDSIKKLTVVNNKMSEALNTDSNVNSSATVHTLQRHRDILRDYSIEYEKTKRNIMSYKEREKLLSHTAAQRNSPSNEKSLSNRRSENNSGSTSLYMKEYDHLKSSHNLIDQQLELAESVKENLASQRQALRFIQQKMNTLAHKFPLINNLVQKIKLKKRKDSIVLGVVISLCIILMLLYLF